MMPATPSARARTKIALVALICVTPVALAWLLASGVLDWQPSTSVAHGQVLANPIELPVAVARGTAGALQLPAGLGRYTYVYISSESCAEVCVRALERLRRAELGTGKQVVNLQRLLVSRGTVVVPANLDATPAGYAVAIDEARWAPLALALGADPAAVFIADPAGRLIVKYPVEFDLKGLADDGKRLLGIPGH